MAPEPSRWTDSKRGRTRRSCPDRLRTAPVGYLARSQRTTERRNGPQDTTANSSVIQRRVAQPSGSHDARIPCDSGTTHRSRHENGLIRSLRSTVGDNRFSTRSAERRCTCRPGRDALSHGADAVCRVLRTRAARPGRQGRLIVRVRSECTWFPRECRMSTARYRRVAASLPARTNGSSTVKIAIRTDVSSDRLLAGSRKVSIRI